jgi:hypothetical protein
MLVSTNPDVRAVVNRALKDYPYLSFERGKRHGKLRNRHTRDFVPVPFSPSDHRAPRNLRSQVHRLAKHGNGLIAAKHNQNHLPPKRPNQRIDVIN